MQPEFAKFTVEIPIADADGNAIREGSVLREINDGERGVVVRVVRKGDRGGPFDSIGDLHIYKSPWVTRVTNRYNQWRHIPHNEQTYKERFISWKQTPFDHDSEFSQISKDEALACNGIMALLPDDVVSDYGPFPDRIEAALQYMVEHLSELESKSVQSDK